MFGTIVSLLVALLLLSFGPISTLASQEATSASALSDLGLPELDVTVTTTAFEGIPEELEAGRYLVTVTAAEDTDYGAGVAFVQPVGMTPDEFLAAAAGPPDIAGAEPGGTPELAEAAATPAEGQGEGPDGPPEVFYDFTFSGGVFALAGETKQVVLDLTPGEWVAWGDDPFQPQEPVVFTVTGEMPSDLTEPASGATITMGESDEYLIEVTEGELVAGQQLVKLENVGAQPHFIYLVQGPDGMTEDQIAAVLDLEMQAEMTGTPPVYTDLNPEEDFEDVIGTGTQSTDTSIWFPVDLEPGTYAMVCFFPDAADGVPHAFYGMYAVFEVGE